jgi:hypothetical protein
MLKAAGNRLLARAAEKDIISYNSRGNRRVKNARAQQNNF